MFIFTPNFNVGVGVFGLNSLYNRAGVFFSKPLAPLGQPQSEKVSGPAVASAFV
jgi:hypothetical protein